MKQNTKFICSNCAYESINWLGRCPSCNSWNTFVEEGGTEINVFGNPGKSNNDSTNILNKTDVIDFSKSTKGSTELLKKSLKRIQTGNVEFDRVLGGGFVDSQVSLLSGEPGIGKSTLLLEICVNLSKSGIKVAYISGEESANQIYGRLDRITEVKNISNLIIISSDNLESSLKKVSEMKAKFVIFDSIQTLYLGNLNSIIGGIAQIRDTAVSIIRYCKKNGVVGLVVGHINKEGEIAGPILLEHLVDTVLYMEGESLSDLRIIRSRKNRYGKVGEIGVLLMSEGGLKSVEEGDDLFVNKRKELVSGVANAVIFEGSRPFVVETQALVDKSNFVSPRRVAKGMSISKLQVLVSIINRHTKYDLGGHDVIVNLPGGLKTDDSGLDLAISGAIISSFLNKPIDSTSVMIGELSLTGEIMKAPRLDLRLKEAILRGYKKVYYPSQANELLKVNSELKGTSTKLIAVSKISELFK